MARSGGGGNETNFTEESITRYAILIVATIFVIVGTRTKLISLSGVFRVTIFQTMVRNDEIYYLQVGPSRRFRIEMHGGRF